MRSSVITSNFHFSNVCKKVNKLQSHTQSKNKHQTLHSHQSRTQTYRAIHIQRWQIGLALSSPVQPIENRQQLSHPSRVLLELGSKPYASHRRFLHQHQDLCIAGLKTCGCSTTDNPVPLHRAPLGTPCNKTGEAKPVRSPSQLEAISAECQPPVSPRSHISVGPFQLLG